ncbi:GNAT family N-acetyltransferase [Rufibacter glacialis]|uniref:N-acetyltransferase n=1 Tax=Rufibacter glacialis TaxID=1259555 RepID=A0A5M8Q5R9_9BACT|nr:GNAT family N-acetyltransferase [Rufibacter glacialis]KAA6430683.1 N-acetyltransferase [Rufibacter glacialis]GGK85790.1 N-acetyltransferase [Rufibacter glacialis]
MTKPEIIHDADDLRFYADLNGEEAELTYSLTDKEELDLDYTYVPEEHRGQGIADQLVNTALEYVKQNQLTFVASCPVVEAYVKRHPEYEPFMVQY